MTVQTKINRVLEHLLFWFVYWIFVSFSVGLYDLNFATISLFTLSQLPLTIIATYLFVYKVLPFFFDKKRLTFFLLSALLFISVLLLRRVSMLYIQFPLFYADSDWTFTFFGWYRIVGHFMHLCAIFGSVSALKLYRNWKRTKDKLDIIQTEKRKFELSYLKAQTSPHFLFNTLNSIYYDVINKNDNSANSIIQLSDLLRYALYECNEDFIPVEKEVELINNYIELQKSRYKNRLTVNMNVSGDVQKGIPPLICFSLVENAFKHGMSESLGECIIDIAIEIDGDNYTLSIKNPVTGPIESYSPDQSQGLGLKNVNRQLALIYNDNYLLTDEVENNVYICTLKIPLNAK